MPAEGVLGSGDRAVFLTNQGLRLGPVHVPAGDNQASGITWIASEIERVAFLFHGLMRAGLFSYEVYLERLVARGDLDDVDYGRTLVCVSYGHTWDAERGRD